MKKIFLIILFGFILILGVYLNRSYANIFNIIDKAGLQASDRQKSYIINEGASSSLSYLALGDSLTAGVGVNDYNNSYPYQVAEKMAQEGKAVTLRTVARPGWKAGDLADKLGDQSIDLRSDVVTLFIGTNDIYGNVSKREFRKNYENILDILSRRSGAKVNIISLPYLGSDDLIKLPYNYYFKDKTREFNEIIKQLAEDYQFNYIDLYTLNLLSSSRVADYYAADLFHPSSAGYNLWAKIIYDHTYH